MQDAGGLDMDPLVFYPHQNDPPRTLLPDRQCHRQRGDLFVDQFSYLIAVSPDRIHFRPFVARPFEVIPGHLVDADGECRLELRVDPLVYHPGDHEFIDKKSGRMAKIEDQRVACRLGLFIKHRVIYKNREKIFEQIVGLVKVLSDLFALLLGILTG